MLHAWKPEHRIRRFSRLAQHHEGLCGSWKRRQKAAAYQSNISIQFLWRCRHETAPSSTAPIRLLVLVPKNAHFKSLQTFNKHLTFRLCFLWRKWCGTLRQAEYFLATIAGQKNVGKIHPWRWRPPYTGEPGCRSWADTSHYNKHPNISISMWSYLHVYSVSRS